MSDFTTDLDDPRTRGWGGHDASLHSQDADDGFSFRSWFFIYFLPPILIGFYIQSDSGIWRFYFGICLLLTLHIVIMPLYNYLTRKKRNDDTPEDYDPRASTIVCDPQGLTIYAGGRIRFQWRWRELDSVLYDGDFLLITLRRGGTVEYGPRHISDADYGDIVAVASNYLNGKAPPLPPAPPAGLDYTWYEAHNTDFLSCINFLLLLLVLCILGPGLLRYGHGVATRQSPVRFLPPDTHPPAPSHHQLPRRRYPLANRHRCHRPAQPHQQRQRHHRRAIYPALGGYCPYQSANKIRTWHPKRPAHH